MRSMRTTIDGKAHKTLTEDEILDEKKQSESKKKGGNIIT